MKKLIVLLLFFLLSATISIGGEELETINYLESKNIWRLGNINLTFNHSDHNNQNNIQINTVYINNVTLFEFKSLEIQYDYAFINDTKSYYYTFENTTYIIKVDYSSIQVPWSPIQEMRILLDQKNETIANLTSQIENLTANSTEWYNLSQDLEDALRERDESIDSLQTFIEENMKYITDYPSLDKTVTNLTIENAKLHSEISFLTEEKRGKERTIDSLLNPFSITYKKGDVNLVNINLAWFFIGGIIFLVGYILYTKRNIFGKENTFLGRTSKKSILGEIFPERREPTKPVDWNEERPGIEEEVLRPKEETHEEVSKEVDSLLYG